MFNVLDADKELHTHPRWSQRVKSVSCPAEDDCSGDKGGDCIIMSTDGIIKCLASYAPGISWADCICDHTPCEHMAPLVEQQVPEAERRMQDKQRAATRAREAEQARLQHERIQKKET